MQKNRLNLHICGIHLLKPYKTVVSHLKLPWCSYLPVKDAEFELSLTRLLLALGTSAREMTQSSLTAYSSLNGGKTVG